MLTQEGNALFTLTDRGTPMGELLRRYWHPIAALPEMGIRSTKRLRIMGEDPVPFKDRSGKLGLIGEPCPHRRASARSPLTVTTPFFALQLLKSLGARPRDNGDVVMAGASAPERIGAADVYRRQVWQYAEMRTWVWPLTNLG